MATLRSPGDILTTELKQIYSAERQLVRIMPRLAKKAESDRLRRMLEERVEQGSSLLERLDRAFEQMQVGKVRAKNPAAEGLIEDATQHLDEVEDERLIDPVLLASVQKIEHYCIAAWGTAASLGRLLEQETVVETMEHVLDEGKRFDADLTKLAENEINPQMMQAEEETEEGDSRTRRTGRRGRGRGARRAAH
jgi:ferritin-like metal-binding protein YciE